MKIETVIRETQWFAESEHAQPDVSVLLYAGEPDVRQVARSVESVLAQSLAALQLVVVDDTGSAQVAEWLDGAQKRDARIGVLRRHGSLGIAAVGWIEAFARARAPWVVIAKACDQFYADALDKLLACARTDPAAVHFGYVETAEHADDDGNATAVAATATGVSMAELRTRNFVGRHAVLIPRRAIEAIGFVDPHVLLAQTAEWDFWRRLSERFELKVADVAVGVTAPATAASGEDGWALEEWMRTRRNDALRPGTIGSYEMAAPNPVHGRATREVCVDLAQRIAGEQHDVGANAADGADGCILIVTTQYDASTALYFDMLPEPWRHRVRVVVHGPNPDFEVLARATVLIVSRAIRVYRAWLDAARDLGVPSYYFLDDNMPVLVAAGDARVAGEDFSLDALRQDLQQFDGVLLSSVPLVDYFREHDLHARAWHFPVACAELEPLRTQLGADRCERDAGELVFAFMGGLHRSSAVWDVIVPALVRIAEEGQRIHFVAPGTGSDTAMLEKLPPTMRVTLLPWDHGYAFALRRFAALSPDYVLLAPGKTRNNAYKTLHPLLTAALVDAVAVLPRTDPYMNLDDGSIALMVDAPFERDGWYAVLRRIVDARVDAAAIKRSNDAFCRLEFSGDINVTALCDIASAAHGVPAWPLQYRRLDMLLRNAAVGGGQGQDRTTRNDDWARSVEELHTLRHMRRYSWRHRVLARPSDLWDYCSPAFWALKRDTVKYGWRRRGSSLEFSDGLHVLPHRDYDVALPAGTLGGFAFAFVVDGPRSGTATVELISPEGQRMARAERDLARADLGQPLRFAFDPVEIAEPGRWRIRVRCRASSPVYVFEIVNRRGMGMFYGPPSPFLEILAPDPARRQSRHLPGEDATAADDPARIDVKFVVDGDIPTNQIIHRLMTEALGADGHVTQMLLSQFSPEALEEGGLVIMSRTASPAALPMLEWMRMHDVPYVCYIDDNFWELTGDTPLAHFYQSAPVRVTLDRAMQGARHIVVNAPRLGEYIKTRYPSARITHLNAPFDFSLIDNLPAPIKPDGEVRVGFAGSVTRAEDFVEIQSALKRLRETYEHVTLVFFGYCPPELLGQSRVTFVPHVASYSEFIRLKASYGLDIGLAPMANLASNLYKTNNKYREYGAMRIAGIYTNTSPYKESVTDGVTGLLVEHNPDAWYRALETLVTDRALRERIADAACADIRQNYAQDVVAAQWREFLADFADEAQAAGSSGAAKTGRASVAYIRAQRWLGHTKIRALVLQARARTKVSRAARRFSGKHNR
ncbi:glycosyltransferase [Burkholderia sp. Ac-20353]|uniref:glycosyltransferase n=1 Tax=Burkholderia sp. Ac-20353 TaxID=2703894 RepID=UPI00197BA2D2|nr:glycosyltransferase [Burkholderia sp. Ac-20353]MBN3789898.1 glycosyltransferase [Burkholderia sp. Ac-20353]